MATAEKEALVAELREAIESSSSIYLTEFHHLSVQEMNELRGQILAKQARLCVVKNRLLKLALAGTAAEELIEYIAGPTAVAFCSDDPLGVAKALTEFGQAHEYIAIRAGLVEGKFIDETEAKRLATLPSRPQLLAQLLAGLNGPVTGLLGALHAVISELVFTLEAITNKRKEGDR